MRDEYILHSSATSGVWSVVKEASAKLYPVKTIGILFPADAYLCKAPCARSIERLNKLKESSRKEEHGLRERLIQVGEQKGFAATRCTPTKRILTYTPDGKTPSPKRQVRHMHDTPTRRTLKTMIPLDSPAVSVRKYYYTIYVCIQLQINYCICTMVQFASESMLFLYNSMFFSWFKAYCT